MPLKSIDSRSSPSSRLLSTLTKGLKFKRPCFPSTTKDEALLASNIPIILKDECASEEKVESLRREDKIRVFGEHVPIPIELFSQISDIQLRYGCYFYQRYLEKLKKIGIDIPTPIQKQSIPILQAGRDLMACAPTGSGKTLSFLIPILTHLGQHQKSGGFRALVLAPTRELIEQIHRDLLLISFSPSDFKICTLTNSLLNGFRANPPLSFDILLSTPLLLSVAVKEKVIDLSHLKIVVLDEADKLLEESFLEQTDTILQYLPERSIKALFTATLPSTVEALAYTFLKNDPIRLFVGQHYAATESIEQKLIFVGEESGKVLALKQLLHGDYKSFSDVDVFSGLKPPILLFVDSIERGHFVYSELMVDNIPIALIHGEKSHLERSTIVQNFRLGKIWVLITTELLARGIDFKGVNSILNFDFPDSSASYIHRIGRTGRAGRKGLAVTLFSLEDADKLRSIANVMKASGCDVPEYMLKLKKTKRKELIKKKKIKKRHDSKKKKLYLKQSPPIETAFSEEDSFVGSD